MLKQKRERDSHEGQAGADDALEPGGLLFGGRDFSRNVARQHERRAELDPEGGIAGAGDDVYHQFISVLLELRDLLRGHKIVRGKGDDYVSGGVLGQSVQSKWQGLERDGLRAEARLTGPPGTVVETAVYPSGGERLMDDVERRALIDLVASRSYCITSPEKVRTRTLDQVRELLATHPALANTNGLALPYVTVGIRATLS